MDFLDPKTPKPQNPKTPQPQLYTHILDKYVQSVCLEGSICEKQR